MGAGLRVAFFSKNLEGDNFMDRYSQERFFQLLLNTYIMTNAAEKVSVEKLVDHIKSELASFYGRVK